MSVPDARDGLKYPDQPVNVRRKFVRVEEIRPDGFVAFDFAVGEPEIYVEMLLPRDAFELFCQENQVIDLTETASSAPQSDFDWRLRDANRDAAHHTSTAVPGGDAAAPVTSRNN